MNSQNSKTDQILNELDQLLREWNSTSLGRRSFLASLPFLLIACGAKEKTRYREGDNRGQETKLTVEDEKRLTKEVLSEMKKDYPPMKDKWMQKYVSDLGDKIVTANDLKGKPYNYSFTAVGVNMVNAFALPAGTIFVTAPLIQMAETEAELAGVIGHEVGHVKARHAAERMDRAKKEQKKTLFSAVGGGLLGGAAGFGLGKLLCPPKDNACLAKATALGAAAGAGAGLLIRKYAFMANSREDEMEADRIGFRTSVNAGYSKAHVGDFYEKLQKLEEKHRGNSGVLGGLADAMSTHPPSRERVAQMKQLEAESAQKKGQVSSKEFEEAKNRAEDWMKKNRPAKKG